MCVATLPNEPDCKASSGVRASAYTLERKRTLCEVCDESHRHFKDDPGLVALTLKLSGLKPDSQSSRGSGLRARQFIVKREGLSFPIPSDAKNRCKFIERHKAR
jgi:hypothetical protein